jgi:pyruvate ferredoxin oxidoreductase gamma subunit
MFRIRLHGRGGQGVVTASRILGSAFFAEGFEVQDAPRYGAERRGAPIFATVRADRAPIRERGPVRRPDLAVVADDTLVRIAAAGVLEGLSEQSVLLLRSETAAETWRERLRLAGRVLTLPAEPLEGSAARLAGAECAGAAARLVGAISQTALEAALREELAALPRAAAAASQERALAAFAGLREHAGCVQQAPGPLPGVGAGPGWVTLPLDPASLAAPDVRAVANSVQVRTGLWRTLRPEIDLERCHRCHWVCSTLCPDSAIAVRPDGFPEIDYDHCKGCMICVAVCPPHAIRAVPEAAEARP